MSARRVHRRSGAAMSTLLVAAIVFSACSGGDNAQDVVTEPTGPPATVASGSSATVASDDASTSAPSEADVERPTPTSEPVAHEPTSVFPWLPDLVLLTEPSDDLRPLLAWEPVAEAVNYSVTVTAPTGVAYWAWQTDTTSVHLGGDPRLDDAQSGPATLPGMTWSVLAFDTNGRPLAASVEAPLHP